MAKIWYFCDPEKNTACSKRSCIHNPERKFADAACDSTSRREYAKLGADGMPCVNAEATRRSEEISRRLNE